MALNCTRLLENKGSLYLPTHYCNYCNHTNVFTSSICIAFTQLYYHLLPLSILLSLFINQCCETQFLGSAPEVKQAPQEGATA